jgi:hypothetical protein
LGQRRRWKRSEVPGLRSRGRLRLRFWRGFGSS